MNQNDNAKKEKSTSTPVEKQQIAEKVESNANIVGGVCSKDGDADGEKGGVVEGDQAVHDHLQRVVVLVAKCQLFSRNLYFCCFFLTLNVKNIAKGTTDPRVESILPK